VPSCIVLAIRGPDVRLYTSIEKPVGLRNDIHVVQGDIRCVWCRGSHLIFPATGSLTVGPQSQIANSFQERKSVWIRNLETDSPVRDSYGKEE
jgi:hypothetical protein